VLWWIANIVLLVVVVPVLVALLNRVLAALERIRAASDEILAGGGALAAELEEVPETLATTGATVDAVSQGAVRYAGSVAKLVTNAAGDAVIQPDGPFVLAGLCLEGQPRPEVQVVMASPGDGDAIRMMCSVVAAPRATLNVQIVGGGVASIFIGHSVGEIATVFDSESVDVPSGVIDVVAQQRNTGIEVFVIARDLELVAGEQRPLLIDFSRGARMAERVVEGDPFTVMFELETANHTRVVLPARYSGDPGPARIFDREALVDGDRQTLIATVNTEANRSSMSRIRADRDSAPVSLPAPTTEVLLLPSMTLSGSYMDASWTTPGVWTYRRVEAQGTAFWAITALPGWTLADPAHDRSLGMPDLAGHPQWDDRYAIRTQPDATGSIELYRPIDALREVGLRASVMPQ
jgi:hypothetical protein